MKNLLAVLALSASTLLGLQPAQAFPDKPVTIVVPFAAGGPVDVIARIIGERMSQTLGQQFIIENVAGAGGTLGTTRVAKSAPDGYTLVMGHLGTHAAAPALYHAMLRYNPISDFNPIGLVAEAPTVVVARKGIAGSTLEDFLKYARDSKGKLSNAHAGVGSLSHITCLLFNQALSLEANLVPYRGSGPAMNDIVSGQVDYLCDTVVGVVPQVQGSTVNAIVISQPERSPLLPNVPSAAELKIPTFNANSWYALFGPAGLPQPVQQRLVTALDEALNDANLRQRLESLGAFPAASARRGPAYMTKFQASEVELWGTTIRRAGVQLQ